jgi:hypothetical protein
MHHIPESLGVLLLKNGASGEGARKGTNGLGEPVGERSGMGMRPLGASSGMRPLGASSGMRPPS